MQPVKALLINPGYEYIEIGLSSNHTILESSSVHKHVASRDLITKIDELLHNNNTVLSAIDFIGVNTGPGPFTTLRVAIATINGLAYSLGVPLIGIDGLDAWILQEKAACVTEYLAVVLNAYSDDVYYAIYNTGTENTVKGCEQIATFMDRVQAIALGNVCKSCITMVGNGIRNCDQHISELNASGTTITTGTMSDNCSLQAVATLAFQSWAQGDKKKMLLPQYMKATPVTMRNKIT